MALVLRKSKWVNSGGHCFGNKNEVKAGERLCCSLFFPWLSSYLTSEKLLKHNLFIYRVNGFMNGFWMASERTKKIRSLHWCGLTNGPTMTSTRRETLINQRWIYCKICMQVNAQFCWSCSVTISMNLIIQNGSIHDKIGIPGSNRHFWQLFF